MVSAPTETRWTSKLSVIQWFWGDPRTAHGADYLRVYLTKPGFASTAEPMGWDDLELITTSPRIPPAGRYRVPVDAGTRTGRHVMSTIWQASHLDQSYDLCSDVNFARLLTRFGSGGGFGRDGDRRPGLDGPRDGAGAVVRRLQNLGQDLARGVPG